MPSPDSARFRFKTRSSHPALREPLPDSAAEPGLSVQRRRNIGVGRARKSHGVSSDPFGLSISRSQIFNYGFVEKESFTVERDPNHE